MFIIVSMPIPSLYFRCVSILARARCTYLFFSLPSFSSPFASSSFFVFLSFCLFHFHFYFLFTVFIYYLQYGIPYSRFSCFLSLFSLSVYVCCAFVFVLKAPSAMAWHCVVSCGYEYCIMLCIISCVVTCDHRACTCA